MQKRMNTQRPTNRMPRVQGRTQRSRQRRPWWLAVILVAVGLILWSIFQGLQTHSLMTTRAPFGPPQQLPRALPYTLGNVDTLLERQLNTLTPTALLQTGYFALDLTTGQYAQHQAGLSFPAASTIKLPILLALLQAIDQGLVQWDETAVLTPTNKVSGSGFLQYKPLGTQLRLWEVADLMITESDNTATHMIIDRLGGMEVLNRRFQWWGLTQTALRAKLPDIEGRNTTSPQDLALTLSYLDQGIGITAWSRDRALDILYRVSNRSLLPTGLAKVEPSARIAHKTGTIGIALGDAGLINLPNGKRYILATLVKRPRNNPQAVTVIQNLSTQVAQSWSTPLSR